MNKEQYGREQKFFSSQQYYPNDDFLIFQNRIDLLKRIWDVLGKNNEIDFDDLREKGETDWDFTAAKTTEQTERGSSIRDRQETALTSSSSIRDIQEHLQCCKMAGIFSSFSMSCSEVNGLLKLSKLPANYVANKGDTSSIEERVDLFVKEDDDEIVLDITKKWVKAIIADFAVCPFTVEPERAGIPRGNVRYTVSRAKTLCEAYAEYWNEVSIMTAASEKDISTIILVFPEIELFGEDYINFEIYTDILDDIMAKGNPLELHKFLNNVYFHPSFKFKDKDSQVQFVFDDNGEILGTTDDIVLPHNYARRSPWPIINILRSPMVQSAQKGIPEGRIFEQNGQRLDAVGSDRLQVMLDSRNWDDLPMYSAFALNSVITKGTDSVSDEKIEYLDNSIETGSDYLNNIDIESKVENEAEDLGDTVEDENAYLLEIMSDTEQWLKDNM